MPAQSLFREKSLAETPPGRETKEGVRDRGWWGSTSMLKKEESTSRRWRLTETPRFILLAFHTTRMIGVVAVWSVRRTLGHFVETTRRVSLVMRHTVVL
jgi:hypothetical protein